MYTSTLTLLASLHPYSDCAVQPRVYSLLLEACNTLFFCFQILCLREYPFWRAPAGSVTFGKLVYLEI